MKTFDTQSEDGSGENSDDNRPFKDDGYEVDVQQLGYCRRKDNDRGKDSYDITAEVVVSLQQLIGSCFF